MRIIKFLLILLVIVGGILYGLYHFGTNMASDKIFDTVTEELEDKGQLDGVNEILLSDPKVKQFIEQNKDLSQLPIQSKEQATRVVLKKVGVSKLDELKTKVRPNMTKEEIDNIVNDLEGTLSQEEILALKVIAYKELNK